MLPSFITNEHSDAALLSVNKSLCHATTSAVFPGTSIPRSGRPTIMALTLVAALIVCSGDTPRSIHALNSRHPSWLGYIPTISEPKPIRVLPHFTKSNTTSLLSLSCASYLASFRIKASLLGGSVDTSTSSSGGIKEKSVGTYFICLFSIKRAVCSFINVPCSISSTPS